MVLWFWDGYETYAYCILAISLMGIFESLYETTVNINRIRSMARYECPITVKRSKNGITTYQEISSG